MFESAFFAQASLANSKAASRKAFEILNKWSYPPKRLQRLEFLTRLLETLTAETGDLVQEEFEIIKRLKDSPPPFDKTPPQST